MHCSRAGNCHIQRSTKLLISFANIWIQASRLVVDSLNTWYVLFPDVLLTEHCHFRNSNKTMVKQLKVHFTDTSEMFFLKLSTEGNSSYQRSTLLAYWSKTHIPLTSSLNLFSNTPTFISCHLNPQLREVKFNSKLKDSLHWCYDIFAFLVDCRMYTRAGEYVVLFYNRFLVGFMSSGF